MYMFIYIYTNEINNRYTLKRSYTIINDILERDRKKSNVNVIIIPRTSVVPFESVPIIIVIDVKRRRSYRV